MTALSPLVRARHWSPPGQTQRHSPLRFVTFLAPKLLPFYEFIAHYVGRRLGCGAQLTVGSSYDELASADVAFVCGLPYVEWTRREQAPVEPVAAPVLKGKRYGDRPVYFSDIIVRRDSPFRSFADLRGQSWAYNEPHSQSGYGITRYELLCRGETNGYFAKVVEAGWHERAIHMVCSGEVDASAIDSHLLAAAIEDDAALRRRLRVIETFGPSTIQPVVAARRLPERCKDALRQILLTMGEDPIAKPHFKRALVRRFTQVTDRSYDDIRDMLIATEAAGLLTIGCSAPLSTRGWAGSRAEGANSFDCEDCPFAE